MNSFDVFLCHNSKDKEAVRKLFLELKKIEINAWFDEECLQPGVPYQKELEKIIRQIPAVIVVIGKHGLGQWADKERMAFERETTRRELPIIPVLLSGSVEQPTFLEGNTWVDFKDGITKDGLNRLRWGITGSKTNNKTSTDDEPPFGKRKRHVYTKVERTETDFKDNSDPTNKQDDSLNNTLPPLEGSSNHKKILIVVVVFVLGLLGYYLTIGSLNPFPVVNEPTTFPPPLITSPPYSSNLLQQVSLNAYPTDAELQVRINGKEKEKCSHPCKFSAALGSKVEYWATKDGFQNKEGSFVISIENPPSILLHKIQ